VFLAQIYLIKYGQILLFSNLTFDALGLGAILNGALNKFMQNG
jgi:hypothetical protein